jgi:hypothetical protein
MQVPDWLQVSLVPQSLGALHVIDVLLRGL